MKWQGLQQKVYLIIYKRDNIIRQEQVKEKLFALIEEIFEINEIDISATMDNVPEWDSLKHIQLITSIEEKFNFEK